MSGGPQKLEFGDLFAIFGFDPPNSAVHRTSGDPYSAGDWFCVAHELVIERGGKAFATKEPGGDGRRILLGNTNGPNASVYTRSASVCEGVAHSEHAHRSSVSTCKLDRNGWVRFGRRVSMLVQHLTDEAYSCTEPSDSPLLADLKRAQRRL